MDPKVLKETIDSFVKGDSVYLRIETMDRDTHKFLQYAGHNEDYTELTSGNERNRPIYGSFWLDLPTFLGNKSAIPIRSGERVQVSAENVRFITNDLQESADHLREIGQEAYAEYVESTLIPKS